jgi:predicted acylesterase/phospholipase RssA
MIHECVEKLIENIPTTMKNEKPQQLDVVLDGGLFNGSYLVGALYFLKEMEKKQYINIERISGVSIGAVVAFLYIIDELDMFVKLYGIVYNDIKKNYNFKIIKKLKTLLGEKVLKEKISLIIIVYISFLRKGLD